MTALFPALPPRSRTVFAIAFVGLIALTVATALSRWQPPLIAVVGLGLPTLMTAYLIEVRAVTRLTAAAVAATATCSVALGVAWAIGTEAAITREGADALGIPASTTRIVVTALAISVGFAVCLVVPVPVIRVWRRRTAPALHGYLVGAVAATGFVASGTLTRLAPSFVGGIDAESTRSAGHLAIAALAEGVAVPVTAVAAAGAVGVSLWTTPRPAACSPLSPVCTGGVTVAAYAGLGLLDIAAVSFAVEMTVYALLAVLALVGLGLVLRAAQRAEAPEPVTPEEDRPRHARRSALGLAVAAAVLVAGSTAVSAALTPPKPNYVCPPDCGRPPIAKPVSTNPRFTPATGEFSVSYPGEGTAYTATFEPNGVVLELVAGDGGVLRLFGEPAEGRSARDIAKQLVRDHYRDATFAYEIPNALVGYHLGYGEVADVFPTASVGEETRARVLVMVAVKNDYALVAAGAGPFREFSPDFGSGHPSGANFLLALDMGKYVNSFAWRGDPAR